MLPVLAQVHTVAVLQGRQHGLMPLNANESAPPWPWMGLTQTSNMLPSPLVPSALPRPPAQLLRNFWLNVALHQATLIGPAATPSWRQAAGVVASSTPVLLIGLDAPNQQDETERLKVRETLTNPRKP